MKGLPLFLCLLILGTSLCAQTAEELYKGHNYKELSKFEKDEDKLTAEQLCMVGFAFFQLENDEKAISFYDKAMARGLDNGAVHFDKGLSLRYMKKYDKAIEELDKALLKDPGNQEYMNEKGLAYYYSKQPEKALAVFQESIKLKETYPESYYWIAAIYHDRKEFEKALEAYYEAKKHIPSGRQYYMQTLMSIGQLEFTFTRNNEKSAVAYSEASILKPDDYEIRYKLMKSYNALRDYKHADSVFAVVKTAYQQSQLPKEDMEIGTVPIAQFEWKGQAASVTRSLKDAKEVLDITYKVFLLSPEGDKVVRRFVVEKTFELEKDGPGYLLCEQVKKTGGHITYPVGWKTEVIPIESLEKAVISVLDEKTKMGASSNFGK
ncbi:MAG: tetratricopeptide repeat protein [Bacteroidia bacterium]